VTDITCGARLVWAANWSFIPALELNPLQIGLATPPKPSSASLLSLASYGFFFGKSPI
jgi:hypothetical protein